MLAVVLMAQSASDPRIAWLPVVLLIVIGLVFVVGTLGLSALIGPTRDNPGKQMTYESGVTPVGDARRRFNVRYYLVAILFLVFDVEIVFFYPWATIFPRAIAENSSSTTLLLVEMLLFAGILVVAYVYAWVKGVFTWE